MERRFSVSRSGSRNKINQANDEREKTTMNTTLTAIIVTTCLLGAVLFGLHLRRFISAQYLSADVKDSVKLAMGLVATMAALLLGLLVSSAKGSYDTVRSQVIEMATKITLLDRMLVVYGPEAAEARVRFRAVMEEEVQRMWPADASTPIQLSPNPQAGNAFYVAIQSLSPQDETQRSLKIQAASFAVELAQLRALQLAQSAPSISKPLLIVVVFWLVVIFLSFSLLAPPNAIATLSMLVSSLSVSGAIFLILELDRPFGGVMRISSEPMLHTLSQLAK